ncbi:MAG TPA: AAA family ATPase [Rhodanobacteraceae bacterium]|nr:AAA family ATPase [Rhodanobacteraceae bacterium]
MRQTLLISGPPGAGKSTLATPLAEALGFALYSKDIIKEALYDRLVFEPSEEVPSGTLSAVAMELLFELAAQHPHVVLDANFKPDDSHQCERLAALGGAIVEVHCRCDTDELIRRYAQRADSRHPAHALKYLTPELIARHDQSMGLGAVIEVDTNGPVDFPALLQRVRAALAG